MIDKEYYIELFRKSGLYNCFPIKAATKIADSRYKASRTPHNQPIQENENYGYIPIEGTGSAIVDLDNMERYRSFAERLISEGYMVIETPHGWHIPVKGLSGKIAKTELFDYDFQPDKKIIEIQDSGHYCVGIGSQILDENTQQMVTYVNRGTDKIWDADNRDFHQFIDEICKECKVTSRRKNSRSSYKAMRERFLKSQPPTEGTSNDYFFQAALQCNSDGLTREEASTKIRIVYDKWEQTDAFSERPWSNIEAKIVDVYDNDRKLETGRPNGSSSKLDTIEIAQRFVSERKIYSDVQTHEIFENKNGFLEKINDSLKRELQRLYPQMKQSDYNDILFKLEGLADPIPATNKNLIVFKNGIYDIATHSIIETNDIADMGFKNYNYLPSTKDNIPQRFIEIMFGNVRKEDHPRIKAGLRSILRNYLDPKISIIHGKSGVGKSTGLEILVVILGVYGLSVELDQLLDDRFIRAKIRGLRLLVLQDLPRIWKDFAQIKTLTGEQIRTERGFQQDASSFDNKLKVWGSGNYLAPIPEHEQNALYSRRLSLIHNTRQEPYQEDPTLIDKVAKEEGEKIISWILNLPDEECKYEDGKTVKLEWETIANPEVGYLTNNWELSENSKVPVIQLVDDFKQKTEVDTDIDQMTKALHSRGYVVEKNMIKNIKAKTMSYGQKRIGLDLL